MTRTALLLDIGGVVLRTPFELLDTVADRVDVPDGALAWRGPFAPEDDMLWRRMQAGELSERQYWAERGREIAKVAGIDSDDPWLAMRWLFDLDDDLIVRPEAVALIEDARTARHTIGLLTNDFGVFHGHDLDGRMAFLETADVMVDRSSMARRKPHPDAYHAALDALDRAADQVLFVDDQPHNVAGARHVGIPSVLFDVTDPGGSADRVRAALYSGV